MVALNARLQLLRTGQRQQEALVELFTALAEKARDISRVISAGDGLGNTSGAQNADGDTQKALDVLADGEFLEAARASGAVAAYCSEEQDRVVVIDESAPLIVAIDPLDGSSNIDVNVSVGTIISVLPNPGGDLQLSAMQPGDRQVAAGFFVYGPQTKFYLTTGNGTDLYLMDPTTGTFLLVDEGIKIPSETSEYAINASNSRHWSVPVQRYVNDLCLGMRAHVNVTSIPGGSVRWSPRPGESSTAAGSSCTRWTGAQHTRTDGCVLFTRQTPWLFLSSRLAGPRPMVSPEFSRSHRQRPINARRWCLDRKQRCDGSVAMRQRPGKV